MNCRPGDLAVVVRSKLGNLGKIVHILRPSEGNNLPSRTPFNVDGRPWSTEPSKGFFWDVEVAGSPLVGRTLEGRKNSARIRPILDSHLRPIRPQDDDAQDESFKWAPAPEKAAQ